MKILEIASLVVVAVLSGSALAQSPGKTRAEVKAETKAAIQSGEIPAPGDSGQTLRERSPQRYEPRKPRRKAKALKSPAAVDRPAEPR